ncbi:hypothetical protein VCHA53O466_40116 [Vibrio chagasii]|nr:hypothetical protein VCHA53O466_40116 [Vibrio chagasii]
MSNTYRDTTNCKISNKSPEELIHDKTSDKFSKVEKKSCQKQQRQKEKLSLINGLKNDQAVVLPLKKGTLD